MDDELKKVFSPLWEYLEDGSPFETKDANKYSRNYVWDILSALRGPDSNDYILKSATTCVIRSYAGVPERNSQAIVHVDTEDAAEVRRSVDAGTHKHYGSAPSHHFILHAKKAFEALGLKWNEVNL